MTDTTAPNQLERAFYAADATWDGRFVAAVRTTGIYCRPSCRGRKPLPANVTYFADAGAASAAGYRACLRCHPDAATVVHTRAITTPIGSMLAGATERAVVLLEFVDRAMFPVQLATLRRRIGPARQGDAPLLDDLEAQLEAYFAGRRRAFDIPIEAPGSPFQVRVWAELQAIPYGETISYRELAERVGEPAASRAVGRANGSNRIAVIIPCHRVIAAGGGLGGYGGGLAAKRWLLDLESGTLSASAAARLTPARPGLVTGAV